VADAVPEVPLKQPKLSEQPDKEESEAKEVVSPTDENDPPKPIAKESSTGAESEKVDEAPGVQLSFRILHCTS